MTDLTNVGKTNLVPCLIFTQSSENDRQSAFIDTFIGNSGPQLISRRIVSQQETYTI